MLKTIIISIISLTLANSHALAQQSLESVQAELEARAAAKIEANRQREAEAQRLRDEKAREEEETQRILDDLLKQKEAEKKGNGN